MPARPIMQQNVRLVMTVISMANKIMKKKNYSMYVIWNRFGLFFFYATNRWARRMEFFQVSEIDLFLLHGTNFASLAKVMVTHSHLNWNVLYYIHSHKIWLHLHREYQDRFTKRKIRNLIRQCIRLTASRAREYIGHCANALAFFQSTKAAAANQINYELNPFFNL